MISESPKTHGSSFINAALELVWPTRCAGCEQPGQLLCSNCAEKLQLTDCASACPQCGAPYGYLICTECYGSKGKEVHSFSQAVSAATLDELLGRIIVIYKDENEHRLSQELAALLLKALPSSWFAWTQVFTWIPADSKALRRRGFDHMERIAAEVARQTALRAERLLNKRACRDQRTLNRQERLLNLAGSFSLVNEAQPLPRRILLIDDVFTTGATLDEAARIMLEGGAREVRVASIARAW